MSWRDGKATFPGMRFREWLAWKLVNFIALDDLQDHINTMKILGVDPTVPYSPSSPSEYDTGRNETLRTILSRVAGLDQPSLTPEQAAIVIKQTILEAIEQTTESHGVIDGTELDEKIRQL